MHYRNLPSRKMKSLTLHNLPLRSLGDYSYSSSIVFVQMPFTLVFIISHPSNYCSFCLFVPIQGGTAGGSVASCQRESCPFSSLVKTASDDSAQDRIAVHERICKGSKKPPPGASGDGDSNQTGGDAKERSVKGVKIDFYRIRLHSITTRKTRVHIITTTILIMMTIALWRLYQMPLLISNTWNSMLHWLCVL